MPKLPKWPKAPKSKSVEAVRRYLDRVKQVAQRRKEIKAAPTKIRQMKECAAKIKMRR